MRQRVEGDTGRDTPLGFPILATKNTTRVPGEDAVQDAAAVATAVYPGFAETQRPQAVTLVDRDQWQAGIAASVLMAPPVKAPVLLTDGKDVPDVDRRGDRAREAEGRSAGRSGAQAFRIGNAGARTACARFRSAGGNPFELAAAIDSFDSASPAQRSANVIVASGSDARYAMPAASWAAKSGDAVLFTATRQPAHPHSTSARRRERPCRSTFSARPASSPSGLCASSAVSVRARRIGAERPVPNAISFARYSNARASAGACATRVTAWCSRAADRPLDAAAAAALASASGTYGPLLLTDSATCCRPRSAASCSTSSPATRPTLCAVSTITPGCWETNPPSAGRCRAGSTSWPRSCAWEGSGQRQMSGAESPDRLRPEHA